MVLLVTTLGFAQEEHSNQKERNNHFFLELGGRVYYSLNYEWAWHSSNRVSFGFGWNHLETYLTPQEAIDKNVDGDHEVSPYLLFHIQYAKLIGQKRSKLELGVGTSFTIFDMERKEIANKLYDNASYVWLYPIIGYRYEAYNGFTFLFTFNPIIQIPQGYFWPIPGVSLGYRF